MHLKLTCTSDVIYNLVDIVNGPILHRPRAKIDPYFCTLNYKKGLLSHTKHYKLST